MPSSSIEPYRSLEQRLAVSDEVGNDAGLRDIGEQRPKAAPCARHTQGASAIARLPIPAAADQRLAVVDVLAGAGAARAGLLAKLLPVRMRQTGDWRIALTPACGRSGA